MRRRKEGKESIILLLAFLLLVVIGFYASFFQKNITGGQVRARKLPICGNGVKEGNEQCDFTGYGTTCGCLTCSSTCQCQAGVCTDDAQCAVDEYCTDPPDCTCQLTQVCGNNKKEGTEECDGTDDQACPGLCQTDCTCSQSDYYIDPVNGKDTNDGRSPNTPFKTIQKGFDVAQPGETIHLADGMYWQDVVTRRNGLPLAPITITGSLNAIIEGAGGGRVFQVFHDYIILDGFTFDGFFGTDTNDPASYRNKLLYITFDPNDPLGIQTGIKVLHVTFRNAGGECLRIRSFAQYNELAYNYFTRCGAFDFDDNGNFRDPGHKNGEAVYMGTSSNQWDDTSKNPCGCPDQTSYNSVHDNTFVSRGNECVDIKEGAVGNIVEYNDCSQQRDPESGGFDARGDENIFRDNVVYDNLGVGVRLGGHVVNGVQYGVNNNVYFNTIRDNANGGIKFQAIPQLFICGNTMSNNVGGDSVGTYGDQFDPTGICPPLTPPLNLVATTVSSSEIDLIWGASVGIGPVTYSVYRALFSSGPFNKIASGILQLSYQDTGLTDQTTYHYEVNGNNRQGETAPSNIASVTTG